MSNQAVSPWARTLNKGFLFVPVQEDNPYVQSTNDIDNLIRYTAPPREVNRRHSSMTAQSRSISRVLNQYRPFDDTYKNLKPTKPMQKTVQGGLKDHVARHGMQAQDIRARYRIGEMLLILCTIVHAGGSSMSISTAIPVPCTLTMWHKGAAQTLLCL